MYIMTIENGDIDYNDDKRIRESGYLEDDITNGCFTTLHYIRNIKEVNKIINIVKDDAIGINVYKMVNIPLNKNIEKKVKQNTNRFFS